VGCVDSDTEAAASRKDSPQRSGSWRAPTKILGRLDPARRRLKRWRRFSEAKPFAYLHLSSLPRAPPHPARTSFRSFRRYDGILFFRAGHRAPSATHGRLLANSWTRLDFDQT
jgi:hypothetical protein